MSGEETQAKGADGARRAKRWLDKTTRADTRWVNPDKIAIPKLTFTWHDERSFSFDLGGLLLGGELANQEFLAECKMYASASDQGWHYKKFLAQCYRAIIQRRDRCDNFMWITWSPFATTEWADLQSPARIRKAVLDLREKTLGVETPEQALESVCEVTCKDVADRLWMIVLSEKQEQLTLTDDHLAVVRAADTRRGTW